MKFLKNRNFFDIFPNSHYATPKEIIDRAIPQIEKEFYARYEYFEKNKKFLEAQRLAQRTKYDLEMLRETGFVKGIEKLHALSNRAFGWRATRNFAGLFSG